MKTVTQYLTERINALVPSHARFWEFNAKGVRWLHPTKGWRQIAWGKLGFKV